ncbi:MAG: FKBP-type peptidyl-prolyl cis-trans isomerase [Saprospiraceae bacterium]|nr:FKBP-type peptidyl-prolyl cis-trans isomerase [Saprospiraceae bacterium]MCF8251405.1 FKBP-type peptidyl-prolyl cis-trans isomerase [Saprospiraceae bacterium]MCF8283050.1 FKBP-type peptidyl-prolyl cis-trans isomerase [Bacteroidales bacterium]MCF8312679.1 FKBP-type peptidyl-prolyl cis-trans isomerase [Saprospiraceae bacterium]MCF8441055.1 FKBP-type peptidyl-prolyl cis-trans isomerase [Saprospiraceae bacterium]
MKKISFLLFAALAALVFACGDNSLVSPNGYKYVKHTNATGAAPNVGDYGYVHISVYQDDSLINSTYKMGRTVPITVPDLTQIPDEQKGVGKANPVADVLALMHVGDSISVEIPIDSTMRSQSPGLKDAKKLVYGIVLADVKNKEQYNAAAMAERATQDEKANAMKGQEAAVAAQLGGIIKDYTAGKNKDKIKTTASGLKYLVLEEGAGKPAEAGKSVDVMYYGMLPNGEEFDNSFKRGQEFSFPLGQGQVIKGWDEGIALLKEGSKAVLFIPSDLAYGDQGTGKIPPKSELMFYVELHKVN